MRFVFGYGSIVNRLSLRKGLGRDVGEDERIPVTLRDHARIWGAGETIETGGRTLKARFLDLAPRPGAALNGILVPVTDEELARLKVREKSYETIEVASHVVEAPAGAEIFAFRSAAGTMFDGTHVMSEYIRLVEDGFAGMGNRFLDRYLASTEAPPVPVLGGRYKFVDPEQNRYTSRG